MTPQKQQQLQQYLYKAAQILYQDTPSEKLQNFETMECTVREQIMSQVAPTIAEFFLTVDKPINPPESEK